MDTNGQDPRFRRAGASFPAAPETPLIPISRPAAAGGKPVGAAGRKVRAEKPRPESGRRPAAGSARPSSGKESAPRAKRAGSTPPRGPETKPPVRGRERAGRPAKRANEISYGDALRRRRRRKALAWLFGTAVLLVAVFASLRVLLKIDVINVTGDTPYTAQQVIQSLPFGEGDSMLTVGSAEAAAELEKALPYIGEAKIVKKLPDVVEIQITAANDTYCVTSISGWTVVSENFKILRLTMEPPENLVEITGAEADAPLAGEQLRLTDEDKQEALDALVAALAATDFPAVTEIDLESVYEIAVQCGDVRVLVGTVNELEEKLDWARYLLMDMQVQGEQGGTLDVSSRNSEGRLTGNWIPG